jgi:ABC-type uncharacterized transport system permease subunit
MLKLEARPQPSNVWSYGSPLLALVITVLIGVIMFLALGKDPLRGLEMFFWQPIRSPYALGELMVKATPLLIIALGLAVCFRSNIWNIGAEGQYIIGAIFAGGVALLADKGAGGWIVVPIVLAGVLGGMLWAAITAVLRDRFNANEILVSLMLVYVAVQLLSYLVGGPWKDPNGFNFPQSKTFEAVTRIPRLFEGSRVSIGVVLAGLGVVAMWVFLFRTRAGFAQQVGGLAPAAARYAGFSSRQTLWTALMISGGAAGLAGALEGADRATHHLCAGRLRVCGHHRRVCGATASSGHGVLCHFDEHVLHRRGDGAVAPWADQVAHRCVPGSAAVQPAGLRHTGELPARFRS